MSQPEKAPTKRGRPPKNGVAMSDSERQKDYRNRLRANGGMDFRVEIKDPELARIFLALKKKKELPSNKATGQFILETFLNSLRKKNSAEKK